MSNSVTLWTVACQAPLSMGLSRQGYWSGLSFPSPGDLPDSEIKPESPVSPVLLGGFFITEPLGYKLLSKSKSIGSFNCSFSVVIFFEEIYQLIGSKVKLTSIL